MPNWKNDLIKLLYETKKTNAHLEHIAELITIFMKHQVNYVLVRNGLDDGTSTLESPGGTD